MWEVLLSSFGGDARYPEGSMVFLTSLQANA
jgi:hypothetical protein